jgi:outer membrane protein assembly factor BamE
MSGLLAALLLAGCSSLQSHENNFLGFITPYRVEVVQGNVLTAEQVALVKPGMSRAQVRDILGSPLLADAFHVDRWDYVFTIRRQGTAPQQRKAVVLFENERMVSIDAPDMPSERDFVNSIDTAKSRKVPKLALSTQELADLPKRPAPAPVATPAPAGPPRSYPPLEPRS